jgi:hypothetical protein
MSCDGRQTFHFATPQRRHRRVIVVATRTTGFVGHLTSPTVIFFRSGVAIF